MVTGQLQSCDMQICMDWRSVDFDWNRARAFLLTAEEGSLSAAARASGMTQPTLGRQVSGLEKELGVVLFERLGRRLELTANGMDLLNHVRAMGEAASRVSLTASGRSQAIDGNICITASEAIATLLLPPVIAALRREHPGIEVEILASNVPSDLQRREADIAVRSFRPTQANLIAKKIKDVPVHLYATPDYLARLGPITKPADLSCAEFVGFDRGDALMNGLNKMGLNLTQRNFPVVSQNHLMQWALVKQGAGIGLMQEDIGDAEPLLIRVPTGVDPIIIPMWLIAHSELKTSRRVRLVFDMLFDALAID